MQAGEAAAVDAMDEVPEGATVRAPMVGHWVPRKVIVGWFAYWAARLSPFMAPDGLDDAVAEFGFKLLPACNAADMCCLVRAELTVLVAEALRDVSQVQAWGVEREGRAMDLGALERNVVRSAWEEAVGEAGDKVCVFQVPKGDEDKAGETCGLCGDTVVEVKVEPQPINIEMQFRDADPDRIAQVFAADMERMVRERRQPVPVPDRELVYLPREEPPRLLREPQPLGEWLRELGRDFMTEARIGLAMLVVIALLAFLLGRLFGFVR